MRRPFLFLSFVLIAISSLLVLPVYAQESTPNPTDQSVELEELALRAEDALTRAEYTLDQADKAVGLAGDMFGLFEVMSGMLGIALPILVFLGGFLGFRRLETASGELRAAQSRFEEDMHKREIELETLRDSIKLSVQQQREAAARASLALSLLPLGERQYRAQDYSGALDTYSRALELDPDNPIIHYRMGYVYTQSGELELAARFLDRSLELDPEFMPSVAARGYVYRRLGDKMETGIERDMTHNKAEEKFLQALNVFPKLMDEDGESWWGSLGGLYRRRGQIEQAIHAYERCAAITPHSSYPFSNLALLYTMTHNRARMLETYKRVEQLAWGEVQAEVDNYWAYADLVTARLALGKIKEAEEILETALATTPSDSPYTLEMLLDTLRRLTEALNPDERPPIEHVMGRIRQYKEKHMQTLAANK